VQRQSSGIVPQEMKMTNLRASREV
jgi:hypothetical protein